MIKDERQKILQPGNEFKKGKKGVIIKSRPKYLDSDKIFVTLEMIQM